MSIKMNQEGNFKKDVKKEMFCYTFQFLTFFVLIALLDLVSIFMLLLVVYFLNMLVF